MESITGRTRPAWIVAQDPGVRTDGRVLMAEVEIPAERLAPGPRGHRLNVIDYDSSTDTLYAPFDPTTVAEDEYENIDFQRILTDPGFQCWNTYAIAMRTLGRFEFALGRKVAWNQQGHQLKIFPHAFRDANAFYAPSSEALMFGYFQGRANTVFSCLAHDVIAHETSHAVIDGLRPGFSDPSSSDQAAFHEGFSDVVALLEVLSVPEVVRAILEHNWARPTATDKREQVNRQHVTERWLLETELFGLAVEMGSELASNRGNALRRSVTLDLPEDWASRDEWSEPHRRGEVLSSVMLRAFVKVWMTRIKRLRKLKGGHYDLGSVAEEGAEAALYLLTTAMRALDYTPPVHLTFSDYRAALLTADYELRPQIDRYSYRTELEAAFDEAGITSPPDAGPSGRWQREVEIEHEPIDYSRSRFEPMQRDPDEVFRFAWENRNPLSLLDDAYTRIVSIRPAVRIAPEDGVAVRETVVEVAQHIEVLGSELTIFGVRKPKGMAANQPVVLRGGATLIFDDYGQIKYQIRNALPTRKAKPNHNRRIAEITSERLDHMWSSGYLDERGRGRGAARLSDVHLRKAIDDDVTRGETW